MDRQQGAGGGGRGDGGGGVGGGRGGGRGAGGGGGDGAGAQPKQRPASQWLGSPGAWSLQVTGSHAPTQQFSSHHSSCTPSASQQCGVVHVPAAHDGFAAA